MDANITRVTQFLLRQAASLLVYQSVFQEEVGQAFLEVLRSLQFVSPSGEQELACLEAYGRWFRLLAMRGLSWQDYLLRQMLRDENPFSRQVQQSFGGDLPLPLIYAAQHDLQVLQCFYACTGLQVSEWVQKAAALPTAPVYWQNRSDLGDADAGDRFLEMGKQLEATDNWADAYQALAQHYRQFGVGLFAEYRALRWQNGMLQGIEHPDPVRLSELAEYDHPRQQLLKNTEALLAGYPALHVLLYGSRGSGKSSLVKALLHQYGDRGLRLIEVAKSDLQDLPAIVERLQDAPQKFVIFVDDLSFEEDEDAYKALKVVLEGNLTARPQNMVVYATSNRRHLIREFFGDRPRPRDADEIHNWDTVQEKLSFSDRFGLTLTFEPADQPTYLAIVHHLAQRAGIALEQEALEAQALQWATRHNGRSGRTARQFIDFLRAELAIAN